MQPTEPLVDIHCHLLPTLDDGAASVEESLAMARLAVADGIGTVIATPHQLGVFGQNDADTIRAKTADLAALLADRGVPLEVLPGADVRITDDMVARIKRGDVLTLADRRRHVLLELPHELYFPLEPVLDRLRRASLVGILSHPERNQGVLRRPQLVRGLVARGCLMQITAGSLLGAFGAASRQLSEWLIHQRLVHLVATDAHGLKSRRPLMRPALDRVAELAGMETALDLCCRNPACVATGTDVPVEPGKPGRHLRKKWLFWRKAS